MYNDVNLLPPKMRKKRKKRVKFDNPSYGLILLILVIVSVIFIGGQTNNKVDELDNTISKLQADINQIMPRINTINAPSQEHGNLQRDFQRIRDLTDGGLPWSTILDQISYSTNPNVTISRIENVGENTIKINADTHTLSDMAIMKKSFEVNPFFSNVNIETYDYKSSSIIQRADSGRTPAVVFEMTFDFTRQEVR